MFCPIPEILEELRAGRMVVLTDDEDRENEGDLVLPAQFVTPESVTFMLSRALGYMCLSLTERDCDRLALHPQSAVNNTMRGTAFTVSIDLHPKHGGTTGVSAFERAKCIRMAIDPATTPDDFVRPGHVNPLRSRDGGVLVRTGQTEGSLDLCRLAGLTPAAAIIEIMRPDGQMARVPDLVEFCKEHKLKMCSVAQIIEHRLARESLVHRIQPVNGRSLRTPWGEFTLLAFESMVDPLPHVVLSVGGVGQIGLDGHMVQHQYPVLVRMHRRHLLGDIFHDLDSSASGATGAQLEKAMQAVAREGKGAVVYLRPEGVGEGLDDRLTSVRRGGTDADSPKLVTPSVPRSTMPMDQREFGIGGQILRALGLTKLRLLTNSTKDMPGLEAFGLQIMERIRLG
ncbi:MAG: 3,4-dihydroxy-2-butanone-4-phosphate synthase [Phycisphaerales bacterium]|jgi:3,4-dihydroxy 2-butanone 4-phosphate synthase/GTP cyclohydrolase II|nr:3,4-dihydroxy-2-butanone-4-phosphate synthase [Phycisphaerales bacterium]